MFNDFLKSLSILKKFLFINLIVFLVIGSLTLIYIGNVKPNLIKNKKSLYIRLYTGVTSFPLIFMKKKQKKTCVFKRLRFSKLYEQLTLPVPLIHRACSLYNNSILHLAFIYLIVRKHFNLSKLNGV